MNFITLSALLTPDIGLMFWSILTFLILFVLLSKYAWKPILNSIKSREQKIEESLQAADKAKEAMESLHAKNEELLKEAKLERDALLMEAKKKKDEIIGEAKNTAQDEAQKILNEARINIEKEKEMAFKTLKKEVVDIAMIACEKILKRELSEQNNQEALLEDYLKESKLN
jgi:F-type H+-transporting ATPase subunit b